MLFDPDEKEFYRYNDANGLWPPVTQDNILECISARILEVSRESRRFSLERHIRHARLKAIVNSLMGIVENRGAFKEKNPFIHVANHCRGAFDTEISPRSSGTKLERFFPQSWQAITVSRAPLPMTSRCPEPSSVII